MMFNCINIHADALLGVRVIGDSTPAGHTIIYLFMAFSSAVSSGGKNFIPDINPL